MKFLSSKTKHQEINSRLQEVLELIHAKRPLLEYEVTDHSIIDGSAVEVSVWQHGQKLGEIHASYKRYSKTKGEHERWFRVMSPFIEKERGERNCKFAKDAKSAARTAIEVFIKKTLGTLGQELADPSFNRLAYLHDRVRTSFHHSYNVDRFETREYFIQLKQGLNPTPPTGVMNDISDEILRKYENLMIAKNVGIHAKNKNGYFIQVMKDETFLVVDLANPEGATKYETTYAMPEALQEKFTILKLLEANQFAADIGIRMATASRDPSEPEEDVTYFVVGGATKTY